MARPTRVCAERHLMNPAAFYAAAVFCLIIVCATGVTLLPNNNSSNTFNGQEIRAHKSRSFNIMGPRYEFGTGKEHIGKSHEQLTYDERSTS